MLDAADKQGLLRVVPKNGIYDIMMPASQRLISVTPPTSDADLPAFASMRFTAQEVEDAAEEMFVTTQ